MRGKKLEQVRILINGQNWEEKKSEENKSENSDFKKVGILKLKVGILKLKSEMWGEKNKNLNSEEKIQRNKNSRNLRLTSEFREFISDKFLLIWDE